MPSGRGRLVLDSSDAPVTVNQILETSSYSVGHRGADYTTYSQTSRFLCMAPCVLDLASGDYLLEFTGRVRGHSAVAVFPVRAGQVPTAHRVALGYVEQPTWYGKLGSATAVVGFTALAAAGALYGGYSIAKVEESDDVKRDALALGGVGAGIAGIGIALYLVGRGVVVRPARVTWELPAPSVGVGAEGASKSQPSVPAAVPAH